MTKRNVITGIFGIFLFSLLFAASGRAIVFEKQDRIHISNLHRIDDDLYAWSSEIVIDGLLEGDFIAGANTISTNGYIKGSENVFASELRQGGRVDGGLRFLVWHANIDGYIGRSVLGYGGSLFLGKESVIEKDAFLVAENVEVSGMIKGNLDARVDKITINGTIDGDVTLKADKIAIVPPAVIKGNLTYTSANEAEIDSASGVTILGTTVWNLPDQKVEEKQDSALAQNIIRIAKVLAAFLFGLIMLYLFRKYTTESINQLRQRFAVAVATGFLTMIIVVISAIILLLSAIMVAVGLVMVSGKLALLGALVLAVSILMIPITSFAAVGGGVLFYSGKIALSLLLGYLLVRLVKRSAVFLSRTQMFVGLLIMTNLFYIPYIGTLIYILAGIIGAGGIVLGIRSCRKETGPETSAKSAPTDTTGPVA